MTRGLVGINNQQQLLQMLYAQQNINRQNTYYNNGRINESIFNTQNNNRCTDGKDDGKIGFFSAIGNMVEGVGKSIVNGVKGMFTDSNGKFSLSKTLLSVGTAALCIAFPAVGLAACAIGGVMGAAKVGKGIYNAATAKTDAEAKNAWENIGDGAFTAVASAYGAKASYGAMKTSAAASEAGSALNALDDTATITQKITALGKDAVNSTKYNAGQIKTAYLNFKDATALHKADDIAYAEKMLEQAKATGTADDITNMQNYLNTIKKENIGYRWELAKETMSNGYNRVKTGMKDAYNSDVIQHPIQTFKNIKTNIEVNGGLVETIKTGFSATQKEILTAMTKKNASYNQLVQQYGYENVIPVLKALAGTTIATQSV